MTDHLTATRRNLQRSRVVVLVAFSITAGTNFLLMGVFARLGGLDLVGDWAAVNAILMIALIADVGVTNALTFRIGRESVAGVLPLLRRLLQIATFAGAAVAAATAALAFVLGAEAAASGIALLAGLLQLSSNWTIALRLGQHEQYWFNIKVIVRVVTQGVLAVAFYLLLPVVPVLAFALAFAGAALIELCFARALTRSDRAPGPPAGLADLRNLTRGFSLLVVAQNGLPPLYQIMIVALSGNTALGYFAVAWRLPVVVTQAVSEALRGLLPGLAALGAQGKHNASTQLLRDALVGQIILVGPALIVLAMYVSLIFDVWLGNAPRQSIAAFYWLAFGTFATSIAAPFFWAVQAYESAPLLSRFWAARFVVALSLGAAAYWGTGSDIVFPAVFAVSLLIGAASIFYVAQSQHGLVMPVLRRIRWAPIGVHYLVVAAFNVILSSTITGMSGAVALTAIVLFNLILFAAATWTTRKYAVVVERSVDPTLGRGP